MTTPLQKAAQYAIAHADEFYALYKRTVTSGCVPLCELQFVAAQKELRKALEAEIAHVLEPDAWLRHDGFKAMADDEKASWIESGNSEVVEEYTKPLYLHPPQPQATTVADWKAEQIDDYEIRVTSPEGESWRLRSADKNDIFNNFIWRWAKSMIAAQGEKQ